MTLRVVLLLAGLTPAPLDCANEWARCVTEDNACADRMEQAPRACPYAKCCTEARACWRQWSEACR